MRRKPSSQNGGYNNQQRKPRFQQGGGGNGGGHHQHGHNRPRKNYAASREKYLAQARDALAAGDRVLAENYYQHADHCYRMLAEEGYFQRNNNNNAPAQGAEATDEQQPAQQQTASHHEEHMPDVTSQLPAFLTTGYEPEVPKQVDPSSIQNWEERDA